MRQAQLSPLHSPLLDGAGDERAEIVVERDALQRPALRLAGFGADEPGEGAVDEAHVAAFIGGHDRVGHLIEDRPVVAAAPARRREQRREVIEGLIDGGGQAAHGTARNLMRPRGEITLTQTPKRHLHAVERHVQRSPPTAGCRENQDGHEDEGRDEGPAEPLLRLGDRRRWRGDHDRCAILERRTCAE